MWIMPLYMDVHDGLHDLTPEAVAEVHAKDLEHQGDHGVRFLRYWFDVEAGKVFCLSHAPNKEATLAVHEKSGAPANAIWEVEEGS